MGKTGTDKIPIGKMLVKNGNMNFPEILYNFLLGDIGIFLEKVVRLSKSVPLLPKESDYFGQQSRLFYLMHRPVFSYYSHLCSNGHAV